MRGKRKIRRGRKEKKRRERIGEINKIEIVRSVKVIKISIKVKARHIIFPQKRRHYGRVCEKCKFGMFKFSSVIEKLNN